MACRLVSAKPLSEPMLEYCQLEQTIVKSLSKFIHFIQEKASENDVWKMAAILSLPQCVKEVMVAPTQHQAITLINSFLLFRPQNIKFIKTWQLYQGHKMRWHSTAYHIEASPKWPKFADIPFLKWKWPCFNLIFTEVCSWVCPWQLFIIGFGNGLVPSGIQSHYLKLMFTKISQDYGVNRPQWVKHYDFVFQANRYIKHESRQHWEYLNELHENRKTNKDRGRHNFIIKKLLTKSF